MMEARAVDLDEMKRQYRAKQAQIRRLEAERAAILERGESTPWRLRFRLEMTLVAAEELRMWGNRELARQIREATKNDKILSAFLNMQSAHSALRRVNRQPGGQEG